MEEKQKLDFSTFRQKIKDAPRTGGRLNTGTAILSRWNTRYDNAVEHSFTIEEIKAAIRTGSPDELRRISKYYYRTNGHYRNNINLLASLPRYDTMISPIYDLKKKKNKDKITSSFYNATNFIDDLNVPVSFTHVSQELLINGTYYGIMREEDGKPTIQDLPVQYCRTRFKDYNGLDLLEFDLLYFDKITDGELRDEVLKNFPRQVELAYRKFHKGRRQSNWIEIPASMGGISFSYGDKTPLLIAAIQDLQKLEEATEREGTRDENELYKLLIQQMPIDNKGELVFQLEEVADIHASVAEMLQGVDTLDVLTTFGNTSLESIQDSSAASQSADRIEKYKTNAYDALGRSSILFNADGSASLAYSIKKDEALMKSITDIYANWLKYQINYRFATSNCHFDFTILPTSVFNQNEVQSQYFSGAQYGYSKMYAGVALGIKQTAQLSLMDFENEFLGMTEKMIPLQSSYTTSGENLKKEEKTIEIEGERKTSQSGGRPELDDTQKSEKTQNNIDGQG